MNLQRTKHSTTGTIPDSGKRIPGAWIDRALAAGIIGQWILGITYAWVLPTKAVLSEQTFLQGPTLFAAILGGFLVVIPMIMTLRWPGHRQTAYAFAVALAFNSLLWIRFEPTRPETCLIILPCLGALALYRNPNPVFVASSFIILHHALCLVFPAFAPEGFTTHIAAEHAIWLLATVLILTNAIRYGLPERTSNYVGSRSAASLSAMPGQFAGARDSERVAERPHVLVVDDNRLSLDVVTAILSKFGCRVDQARDGREAVDAIARIPYDTVFMDCEMPGMNGYDATAEIRRMERGKRHTWIVALTGNDQEGDRDICLVVGMDDYLTKPPKPAKLKAALRRSPAARLLAASEQPFNPAVGKMIRLPATKGERE